MAMGRVVPGSLTEDELVEINAGTTKLAAP